MPFATAAIIGGAALAGSAISAHAAGKAADAQVNAAKSAAELQHEDAQAALGFQKDQWNTQQKNFAPWLKAGTWGINSLSDLLKNGGFPDWNEQFKAPTMADAQNDPGYAFGLQQGQQALERSAAARGGVLSGGTAKAETMFGNDYATTKYNDVYNRAYDQYATRYNQFQTNQANRYNRLASLAGVGQQAANSLGLLGQNYANQSGTILMNSGQQIGNDYLYAGAARASGYLGAANAWNGGITSLTDLLSIMNKNNNGGPGSQSWMLGPHG